ncbi:uncharacterized protein CEXT_39091 [Caerostris extrusa]|uniref:Uncharacterized protein n=1 Tax=Caerostris extrusa TaxID=172846 RepID=A0AAV4NL73_CAEEX|nr:uncharacterized protein CEXT_39091 [Caerostris extrusa]
MIIITQANRKKYIWLYYIRLHFFVEAQILNTISIMLSAHQIFNENSEVTSIKNVKTNTNSKGLGLKNSTNINVNQKSKFSLLSDPKKHSNVLKKTTSKSKMPSIKQEESVSEEFEKYPEVENMYIYDDSDDDYEHFLPKSERITKSEIEFLLPSCFIQRFQDNSVNDLPSISLENMEDLDRSPCHSINYADLLFDDSSLQLIDEPW